MTNTRNLKCAVDLKVGEKIRFTGLEDDDTVWVVERNSLCYMGYKEPSSQLDLHQEEDVDNKGYFTLDQKEWLEIVD